MRKCNKKIYRTYVVDPQPTLEDTLIRLADGVIRLQKNGKFVDAVSISINDDTLEWHAIITVSK